MHDIQFIYFDVGGVILEYIHAYDEIQHKTNKSLQEIQAVFESHSILNKIDTAQMLDTYNQKLDLRFTAYDDFVRFYTNAFIAIPQTHDLIKTLVTSYPLGLLSNTEPHVLETSIKLGKIPDISYSAIVASCYEGYRKPEKEIYIIAQEKAKKNANNILFIDDLQENIDKAKELGWQTILFDTKAPEKSVDAIKKLTL